MMMNLNVVFICVPFLPRSMGVSGCLAVCVPIVRLRFLQSHTACVVVRWQIVCDHLWWLGRGLDLPTLDTACASGVSPA